MSSTTSSAISAQALEGNRLLALLSPDTRRRMLPAFTLMTLEMSHVLYEPNRVITHIYFPLTAVTSVLSEMDDGTTVEVATIGREGMVGLSVFLGDTTTFLRTIAQVPGTALSMAQADFLRIVEERQSGLQALLLRYTQALFSKLAQQSACKSVAQYGRAVRAVDFDDPGPRRTRRVSAHAGVPCVYSWLPPSQRHDRGGHSRPCRAHSVYPWENPSIGSSSTRRGEL